MWLLALGGGPRLSGAEPEEPATTIGPVVESLMEADTTLADVRFADVIEAATGRRVLRFDPADPAHAALRIHLRQSLDTVLTRLADPAHPVHRDGRINEVSAFFEEALRETLDAPERYTCDFPRTAAGDYQRSGYPDLRIEDRETGLVAYLDPKLYAADSETSRFRTFYYEPKRETNKVLEDALHFLSGIAHAGRGENGAWQFTGWRLVDLSDFRVRLKAEFQSGNHELYRDELIIESSHPD